MRWAYYPWRAGGCRGTGSAGLSPAAARPQPQHDHHEEQDRLAGLRIGVIGLSVGHAIAHTLAAQGLCGELRMADFDTMELSNLNRVPATVFDIGVNKAVVAARRIAELDPTYRSASRPRDHPGLDRRVSPTPRHRGRRM